MFKMNDFATLVGANDAALAQNKFSASVAVDVPHHVESLVGIHLKQGYAGGVTGANLTAAGTLYFFRSDPAITAGTAINGLTEAQANLIIGTKAVAAGDWADLATTIASFAHYFDNAGVVNIPTLGEFYVAFLYTGATSFNSAAGDDETLLIRFVYQ
jgi:hypothetical protein